jgi:hypothetical protein
LRRDEERLDEKDRGDKRADASKKQHQPETRPPFPGGVGKNEGGALFGKIGVHQGVGAHTLAGSAGNTKTRFARTTFASTFPAASRADKLALSAKNTIFFKEISAQNIEASIRKLVIFGTRHTLSTATSETRGIGAARRWLQSEFKRYSKDCRWTAPGHDG